MNSDEIIKELESLMQKVKQESKEESEKRLVYFLNLCPFCGSSAQFDHLVTGKGVRIVCEACKCSTDWYSNKSDAVKTWNERV